MRILTIPCRCAACLTEFWGELLDESPLALAIKAMREIWCPACNSKKVLLLTGEQADKAAQRLAVAPPKSGG